MYQRDKDYLVIGQGLAGTVIAEQLLQHHMSLTVIDPGGGIHASQIAAGIMNPITGRRFVMSWMYDELLQIAIPFYEKLEVKLDQVFLDQRNIIRSPANQGALSDWLARSEQSGYQRLIVPRTKPFRHPCLQSLDPAIENSDSYQLFIPKLVNSYRRYLEQQQLLHKTNFSHEELKFSEGHVTYQDVRYRGVIFCEGARISENPFFPPDLLNPSVGERIEVRIADLYIAELLKYKYYLLPWEAQVFWFGAFTHWNVSEPLPTAAGKSELSSALTKTVKVPFEIKNHAAAIRPTVVDRRPILGTHPELPQIHLFNGLGTKGASLAPYWSQVLIDHLLKKKQVPSQVSIDRFFN